MDKEEKPKTLYGALREEYHKYFKFDEYMPKLEKLKNFVKDKKNAVELYQALAENLFTWRASGGIVANLRGNGETYTEYYCSGKEGHITRKVNRKLKKVGITLIRNYTYATIKHRTYWRYIFWKQNRMVHLIFSKDYSTDEKKQKKVKKYLTKIEKKEQKRKKKEELEQQRMSEYQKDRQTLIMGGTINPKKGADMNE